MMEMGKKEQKSEKRNGKEIFVRIKGPKLIKIRNNLRNLLLWAYFDKAEELHKLLNKARRKKNRTLKTGESYSEINQSYVSLSRAKNRSIIYCPNCQSSEKDMVKTKVKRQWVCIDCYNLYKNMFKKELEEVKTLLRARTKRGEGIHLEYFGEENLNVLSEDLKEKFREWGGKINEKDELIDPKEHIEEFLNHLDELECPWI